MGEEAKVERKLTAWATRAGLHCWKMLWPPGAPDRIVWGRDFEMGEFHVVFIEFKAPSGTLAPKQIYWRDMLMKAGASWYCLYNFEDAKRILNNEFGMGP